MQVLAINQINSNKYNYGIYYPCRNQTFKAMPLGKPNSRVTPKIRSLAETVTDILNNMKGKDAFETVINGVKINHTGERFGFMAHEHVVLTKTVNEKNISVELQTHPHYGTGVLLKVPINNYIEECFTYESNSSGNGDRAEKFEKQELCGSVRVGDGEPTSADIEMFEKYVGEILADADSIKEAS